MSAQQARERKKVYVSDLESRATELQDRNSKLEEKISTLINENTMLRKVLIITSLSTSICSPLNSHYKRGMQVCSNMMVCTNNRSLSICLISHRCSSTLGLKLMKVVKRAKYLTD